MRFTLIALFIFWDYQVVAQQWDYQVVAQQVKGQREIDSIKWVKRTPLSVYFEPLAFVDNFHFAYRFGIELPVGKRMGFQLGGIANAGDWDGYAVRIGMRKYFRPLAQKNNRDPIKLYNHLHKRAFNLVENRPYLGIEFSYRTAGYSSIDTLVHDHRMIDYEVSKETYTLNFLYGHTFTYRCGIFVQSFIGFGIRMKNSTNSLSDEQEQQLYHWREGEVQEFADGDFYKAFFPTLPMGFRVGYRFR